MCSDAKERSESQPLFRILLIEDNDDIQKIIQLGLKMSGLQVIAIKTHEDCLTLAKTLAPDLILLDMHANGVDILAQLHSHDLTQRLPIVCLVSRDRTQDQRRIKQQGATAIVAKPFDVFNLAELISAILMD